MSTETAPRARRRVVQVDPTPEEVAAAKLIVHEGFVLVQRVAYGKPYEDRTPIQVPLYATEVARVRVSAGTTRNLGDFNSARVDVTIELPCYPVQEEIRAAYDFIAEQIDELFPIELAKAGVDTGEPQS